jgi:transposase-like protein
MAEHLTTDQRKEMIERVMERRQSYHAVAAAMRCAPSTVKRVMDKFREHGQVTTSNIPVGRLLWMMT